MNFHAPRKTFKLPHRTKKPLGISPFLLAIDWLSTTWFRFNVTLIWIVITTVVAFAPYPMTAKLIIFMFSPVIAFVFYYLVYFFRIVLAFDEKRKLWVGYLELGYLRMFSRLVVQEIELDLPLWH